MDVKRTMAVFAILLMSFLILAAVSFSGGCAEEQDDEEPKTMYLSGVIDTDSDFPKNQTIIVNNDLLIKNGAEVIINGAFIVEDKATITIEGSNGVKNSQLKIYSDATIDGSIINKCGVKEGDVGYDVGLTIEPSSYMNVVTVNGTIKAVGDSSGSYQKSMVLKSAAVDPDNHTQKSRMIINGQLIIGTATVANVTNAIVSEGALFSNSGAVNGSIVLYGEAYFDGSVVSDSLASDFKISIAGVSAEVLLADVKGSNPIVITDKGMLAYNYGGIDYYIGGYPDNISAMREKALTYDSANQKFSQISENVITFTSVKNVKIKETLSTYKAYDTERSKTRMYVDPCISIGALDGTAFVTSTDSTGAVKAVMTVEKGNDTEFQSMTILDTRIHVKTGVISAVAGDIKANDTASEDPATVKVEGKLVINGSLVMSPNGIAIGDDAIVTAAMYIEKTAEEVQTIHYTTFTKALSEGAVSINVLGTLTVAGNITVPEGIKVYSENDSAKFDSLFDKKYSIIVERDGSLTIAVGALFTFGGDMAVQGTFVIEDMNSGINFDQYTVYSDVMSKTGVSRTYTNLVTALENSSSGDAISIYKPASRYGAVIDGNVTIPFGVKLTIPEKTDSQTYTVTVLNGYILKVDGTLEVLAGGALNQLGDIEGKPGNGWSDIVSKPKEGELLEYSVLMIGDKGVVKSASKMEYEVLSGGVADIDRSYRVAGAYLQDDDGSYYISTIPFAFENIRNAKDMTVSIYGKNSISGRSVNGAEGKLITVVFKSGSEISMNGFRFSYGKVVAETGSVISGDIGTGNGSICFGETTIPSDPQTGAVFEQEFVGESMNLTVSGTFCSEHSAYISGAVYVYGDSAEDWFVFKGKADPKGEIPQFTIPADSKMIVVGDVYLYTYECEFLVKGVLTLTNGGHLVSSIMSVLGTLDVTLIDGKAATAAVDNLLIGGCRDTFEKFIPVTAEGETVVIGSGTFAEPDALYVFNGATVSAGSLLDLMERSDKNTQFYIDKALWLTVYVQEEGIVKIASANGQETGYEVEYHIVPALYNRLFKAWQIQEGKELVDIRPVLSATVGESKYSKVYASLKDDIYSIMVVADKGISDVYLNGKIMVRSSENNTFSMDVPAGEYTITYNIAQGYTGEASIMAIDGKMITGAGLTFKVNDDLYDIDRDRMVIQLTGIIKSEDPEPESPVNFSVFMLIILIGIIAIVAVALYRMRRY